MNWWLFGLGLVMVITAWTEAIWTALWIDGHGAPLTTGHTALTHWMLTRVSRALPRLRSLSGPVILVSVVLFWTLLLWVGFSLIFSADRSAVVATLTGTPARWQDRVYFVGYAIFTFGNGDFTPRGTVWQWLAAGAGMSGLFLISLTVTYLLSVLGAAVNLRGFASEVHALGRAPEEFVIHCWDGSSFNGVELQLVSLSEKLSVITERLAAYPMAHYYHARSDTESLARGVAIYDEALLLFMQGVQPRYRPARGILHAARETVGVFLENSRQEHIARARDLPPLPRLARLQQAGVPVVPAVEFEAGSARDRERRELLLGLVRQEGREWPDSATS